MRCDSRRLNLIRPATSQDIRRLGEIAKAAYRGYVSRIGREPAPMVADFPKLVTDGYVWVLNEPIDGYIVMYPSGDELHVENVAVDPLRHGEGLGKRLIEFAEARAASLDLDKITLYTNVHMTENLSFYPAHGFVETGRRHEQGFDRVYFAKSVSHAASA